MERMAKLIYSKNKQTGTTYVYESEAWWDKEKQQSRSKRRLIGKLDPETGEIIPTRKYERKQVDSPASPVDTRVERLTPSQDVGDVLRSFKRLHYGATYALQEIAKKTHVYQGLKELFPHTYQAYLSLAYYLVLAPSNAMVNYTDWAAQHYTYHQSLSSQRISDLFKLVDEDKKQQFFRKMFQQHGEKEFWAYDTTSISSYSEVLSQVQYGKNKENDALPQLNLALLYGEKSRLPFCYRAVPGNISDVQTLPWLLNQLEDIEADSVGIVMDRGHYSKENVLACLKRNQPFILGTKLNLKYVSAAFDQIKAEREDFRKYHAGHGVYCHQVKETQTFKASATSTYPVTLHFYYDPERAYQKQASFTIKLAKWQEELMNGKEIEAHRAAYKKYFTKKGTRVDINQAAIQASREKMGWFVLLTNTALSSVSLLNLYRNKDVVEKAFEDIKGRLSMRRLRVSSDVSLEGKLFVQYLALILVSSIKKVMDDHDLYKDYTFDKLINKLNLIDCYINTEGERYQSEIVEKQRLIYRHLGITVPE